jgi:hypothetical protein
MPTAAFKTFLAVSAVLVIAGIIKAFKSGTPVPWTVPPKWRPLFATVLGMIGTGIASFAKSKWPNLPLDWEEIFGIGIIGPAGSSLFNGLLGTGEAIKEGPPVVKSVRPPSMKEGDIDAKP